MPEGQLDGQAVRILFPWLSIIGTPSECLFFSFSWEQKS